MDLRDLGGLSPLVVAPLGKQGVFWTLLVSICRCMDYQVSIELSTI
jgi:hypothetical protein